ITRVLGRLDGPAMVATLYDAGETGGERVIVAVDIGATATEVDTLVARDVLPLAAGIFLPRDAAGSPLSLDHGAAIRKVMLHDEPVFTYAVKDGRLLGSTDGRLVADWLAGQFPKRRWAQGRVRSWIGSLAKPGALRVLFNPLPL